MPIGWKYDIIYKEKNAERKFSVCVTRPVSRVLSRTVIYLCSMSPYCSGDLSPCHPRIYVGPTNPYAVLLRIGFTASRSYLRFGWALTSPFHPYRLSRRFISVALARKSPSADVISYPALWSSDFPHGTTFRCDAARPFSLVTNILYHFFCDLSRANSAEGVK